MLGGEGEPQKPCDGLHHNLPKFDGAETPMKTDIERVLRQDGAVVQRFAVLSQLSYNLGRKEVSMVGAFIVGCGATQAGPW